MKFDEKYPNADTKRDYGMMWKCPTLHFCMVCSTPTQWVDLCYEAFFCSEECVDKLDVQYLRDCAPRELRYRIPYLAGYYWWRIGRFWRKLVGKAQVKQDHRDAP